jgi:hypothetical protein
MQCIYRMEYYLAKKEEWNPASCNSMDGARRHHIKRIMFVIQKDKYHSDITCMIYEIDTWKLIS